MKGFVKVVVCVAGLAALRWAFIQVAGSDEIDYQGRKFKLAKKYIDYDAYKNDPNNLAASEIPRIEQMIVEAKVGSVFKDWAAFGHEVFQLKVPGYGFGGGPKVKAVGREFFVSSVEIPTRPFSDKNRYFVLEKLPDQSLKLVDDFVAHGFPFLAEIDLRDGRLIYRSKDKTVVRETQL